MSMDDDIDFGDMNSFFVGKGGSKGPDKPKREVDPLSSIRLDGDSSSAPKKSVPGAKFALGKAQSILDKYKKKPGSAPQQRPKPTVKKNLKLMDDDISDMSSLSDNDDSSFSLTDDDDDKPKKPPLPKSNRPSTAPSTGSGGTGALTAANVAASARAKLGGSVPAAGASARANRSGDISSIMDESTINSSHGDSAFSDDDEEVLNLLSRPKPGAPAGATALSITSASKGKRSVEIEIPKIGADATASPEKPSQEPAKSSSSAGSGLMSAGMSKEELQKMIRERAEARLRAQRGEAPLAANAESKPTGSTKKDANPSATSAPVLKDASKAEKKPQAHVSFNQEKNEEFIIKNISGEDASNTNTSSWSIGDDDDDEEGMPIIEDDDEIPGPPMKSGAMATSNNVVNFDDDVDMPIIEDDGEIPAPSITSQSKPAGKAAPAPSSGFSDDDDMPIIEDDDDIPVPVDSYSDIEEEDEKPKGSSGGGGGGFSDDDDMPIIEDSDDDYADNEIVEDVEEMEDIAESLKRMREKQNAVSTVSAKSAATSSLPQITKQPEPTSWASKSGSSDGSAEAESEKGKGVRAGWENFSDDDDMPIIEDSDVEDDIDYSLDDYASVEGLHAVKKATVSEDPPPASSIVVGKSEDKGKAPVSAFDDDDDDMPIIEDSDPEDSKGNEDDFVSLDDLQSQIMKMRKQKEEEKSADDISENIGDSFSQQSQNKVKDSSKPKATTSGDSSWRRESEISQNYEEDFEEAESLADSEIESTRSPQKVQPVGGAGRTLSKVAEHEKAKPLSVSRDPDTSATASSIKSTSEMPTRKGRPASSTSGQKASAVAPDEERFDGPAHIDVDSCRVYCVGCGSPNQLWNFCYNCGAKLVVPGGHAVPRPAFHASQPAQRIGPQPVPQQPHAATLPTYPSSASAPGGIHTAHGDANVGVSAEQAHFHAQAQMHGAPQYGFGSGQAFRHTAGSHMYDRPYTTPPQIMPLLIDPNRVEGSGLYSPALLIALGLFKRQLDVVSQFVATNRTELYQEYEKAHTTVERSVPAGTHHYTTLEETKAWISENRRQPLTMEDARTMVERLEPSQ